MSVIAIYRQQSSENRRRLGSNWSSRVVNTTSAVHQVLDSLDFHEQQICTQLLLEARDLKNSTVVIAVHRSSEGVTFRVQDNAGTGKASGDAIEGMQNDLTPTIARAR